MHRVLAPALVAFAVAGCAGSGVTTMIHPYPYTLTAARGSLQDIGAQGPVLLEVRGNPFPEDAAPLIAETASRTSVGFVTRFTTDPREAPRPDYRMVVQFDPDPRLPANAACDPRPPAGQPVASGQITALVVYCRETNPLLALTAWAPRPAHADSPAVHEIAEQAMIRMFGGEPRGSDSPFGNDNPVLRRLRS